MWNWFRKLFSNYSKKTVHLYRIFLYKVDIYLLNRKKNKYFKQIGKTFYNELLNHKDTDQIIEIIQPIFSSLDLLDKKIDKFYQKISDIAKKENIPKEDVDKIDQFIENADKKIKDSIFDENEDIEFEDEEIDLDLIDTHKENKMSEKKNIKGIKIDNKYNQNNKKESKKTNRETIK